MTNEWCLQLEKSWEEKQNLPTLDAEWLAIFPEAEEYLRYRAKINIAWIGYLVPAIKEALRSIKKNPNAADWLRKEIIRTFLGDSLNRLTKETKRILWLIRKPEKTEGGEVVVKKERITAEMIARAKEFPINQVILVDRRGFSPCVFHKEKFASMWTKKNFCHCFACGKSADTIELVQKIKGCSFPEAVEFLQN